MAHEITLTAGKDEIAFVGDRSKIWHGLGQELTVGSPIEVWEQEAGMNWKINSSPLKFNVPGLNEAGEDTNETSVFEGKQVLYRSDTKAPLSVVSERYKVVQPKEVLEFFRSLVDEAGFQLSTAGTLFGGKKFWALADTHQRLGLSEGKDVTGGYLLLSTSCDGTLATSAQFTSVRVVCNNTLSIALNASGKQRVATSHSTEFQPNNIKAELGLYENAWDKFSDKLITMSQVKVTSKDAYDLILEMVAKDVADPTNAEIRNVNEIINLYMGGGKGSDLAGQTAYGLLNAFTEYYDHHVGRIASNRLNSSFWGLSNANKLKAQGLIESKFGIAA
jgi:phage/plasmid-like protein (TIGR03299 family)